MSKCKLTGIAIAVALVVIVTMGSGCPPATSGMSGTYVLTEAGTRGDQFLRLESAGNELRFNSDGTVLLVKPDSRAGEGKWKLTGNELQIEFESMGSSMVFLGQVSGDTITFEYCGSVWRKG